MWGADILQLRRSLDQRLQAVGVAHGSDVGDNKFSFGTQPGSQIALRLWTE